MHAYTSLIVKARSVGAAKKAAEKYMQSRRCILYNDYFVVNDVEPLNDCLDEIEERLTRYLTLSFLKPKQLQSLSDALAKNLSYGLAGLSECFFDKKDPQSWGVLNAETNKPEIPKNKKGFFVVYVDCHV